MGVGLARLLALLFGLALVALGVVLVVALPGGLAGIFVAGLGAALIIGAAIERLRYRSASAERTNGTPGPGGGEPLDLPMEPRFRRTEEVFVDPTTDRAMRVWIDPASGERRYRAED